VFFSRRALSPPKEGGVPPPDLCCVAAHKKSVFKKSRWRGGPPGGTHFLQKEKTRLFLPGQTFGTPRVGGGPFFSPQPQFCVWGEPPFSPKIRGISPQKFRPKPLPFKKLKFPCQRKNGLFCFLPQ